MNERPGTDGLDDLVREGSEIAARLRREIRAVAGLAETGAASVAPGSLRERWEILEQETRRLERILSEKAAGLRDESRRLADGLKATAKEKEKFATLLDVSRDLNSNAKREVDGLLDVILDRAIRVTGAERGFLVMIGAGEEIDFRSARCAGRQDIPDAQHEISRSIIHRVARTGQALVLPNALDEPDWRGKESVRELRILSVLGVPLRLDERTAGVLYLESRSVTGLFQPSDLELLEGVSYQASIALENARLYEELRSARERLSEENIELKSELRKRFAYEGIIGKSDAMQRVYALIEKVAPSRANILVRGESGTGKELIAKVVHYKGPRAQKPFVKVNCAAIPETLLESELFGIEGGTATGVSGRPGKFEVASGGTIFLDEIGDMSLMTQAKVLRVIQEREFERVGGRHPIRVDVRIIAATNIELERAIEERRFREDLYYRLNVVTIWAPPLRERMGDLQLLLEEFLARHCREHGLHPKRVSAEALDLLLSYAWPGNVRELENVVERAVILTAGDVVTIGDLPEPIRGRRAEPAPSLTGERPLEQVVGCFEKRCIEDALDQCGWVQTRAAERLGMTERNLRYKMKKYGIRGRRG